MKALASFASFRLLVATVLLLASSLSFAVANFSTYFTDSTAQYGNLTYNENTGVITLTWDSQRFYNYPCLDVNASVTVAPDFYIYRREGLIGPSWESDLNFSSFVVRVFGDMGLRTRTFSFYPNPNNTVPFRKSEVFVLLPEVPCSLPIRIGHTAYILSIDSTLLPPSNAGVGSPILLFLLN